MSQILDCDETVRLFLSCGTAAEIQEGFALIEKNLRDPVCGWVRTDYAGISPEDLADVWQESLIELFKQVKAGKYTGERKVFTDLCQIIHANGIDQRRRHKSRENLHKAISDALRGTQSGQKWKDSDPVHRHEILNLIREAGAQLVGKQRIVLEAFVANFPESLDMQELKRFTSAMTGEEETLASVKGALREVRKKLRKVLSRKGYDYSKPGDDYE